MDDIFLLCTECTNNFKEVRLCGIDSGKPLDGLWDYNTTFHIIVIKMVYLNKYAI